MEKVFVRLMEHGLKLKPFKCCFSGERVTYVGHQLSADGVSPDPDEAVAVAEWKVPSSVKELSSFLGVAGYYRRFVSGFAQIEGPLHELVNSWLHKLKTKKLLIIPFENRWSNACHALFEVLREKLTIAPLIAFQTSVSPSDWRVMQVKKMMGNIVLSPMPVEDSDARSGIWKTTAQWNKNSWHWNGP